MSSPTKADLTAAVAKLTEENKGLRDLLAAISLVADTVPVSKDSDYTGEWKRSTRVLANIKRLAGLNDWNGYLAYAAKELRLIAAEPVGYEVYVKPEADELHARPAPAQAGRCGHVPPPELFLGGYSCSLPPHGPETEHEHAGTSWPDAPAQARFPAVTAPVCDCMADAPEPAPLASVTPLPALEVVADREEMVEFTSTSLPGHPTARCSEPGFHDPSVADRSVFCDRPEHHEPASVTS